MSEMVKDYLLSLLLHIYEIHFLLRKFADWFDCITFAENNYLI